MHLSEAILEIFSVLPNDDMQFLALVIVSSGLFLRPLSFGSESNRHIKHFWYKRAEN